MTEKRWPLLFWQRTYWQQWFRTAKTSNNIATLHPRQIYILPTRWGLLYAVMLIALLVGSINYSLSLGYYVTFLLASMGNIAMLHTWRNLVHLQVSVSHTEPVFAGDVATIIFKVNDTKNRPRYNVVAYFEEKSPIIHDVSANNTQLFKAQLFNVPLATQKRGLLNLPRLTLHTEFPLSLLHAWAVVEHPFQVLVYPKPSNANYPNLITADANTQGSSQMSHGDDEFNGHKTYQLGDTPSRVDWKASSRGIGMYTKLYSGAGSNTLWLDWESTQGDQENRISQLTRWVIDANANQQSYGVKLPNMTLQPGNTQAHYHQALTALALFS